MVLCQKRSFSMPLSSLIIFIWISIATLGVMASKNLWDTIGETADPKDDIETYEKNLCSNPLIDCYGCQNFNDDSTNCRLQPDCWYNCEASTCQNITEFDEKYTCSQYCDDECHCFGEPKCYYIYAEKKCDFVERCHEGEYDLKKNFEASDCIKGSDSNRFYLIGGSACASNVPTDSENCEEEPFRAEIILPPKEDEKDSYDHRASHLDIRENARHEFQLRINRVDWDAGDFQLYNITVSGEPMVVRLRKADFKDRSENVTIIVSFITEDKAVIIRGYKGPQNFHLVEKDGRTQIELGSLLLRCSNIGDQRNKIDVERFVFMKD